jgi:hypothetical protein
LPCLRTEFIMPRIEVLFIQLFIYYYCCTRMTVLVRKLLGLQHNTIKSKQSWKMKTSIKQPSVEVCCFSEYLTCLFFSSVSFPISYYVDVHICIGDFNKNLENISWFPSISPLSWLVVYLLIWSYASPHTLENSLGTNTNV